MYLTDNQLINFGGRKMIKFKVNGKYTNNEEMGIVIPERYAHLFNNHNFKDIHNLSMALMFANCAFEAMVYNNNFKLREHENNLKNIMEV
jgi:hypothetical protein